MNTSTPTPKTDEQIGLMFIPAGDYRDMYYAALQFWNDMAKFSCQLERENQQQAETIARLSRALELIRDSELSGNAYEYVCGVARAALVQP